MSVYQCFLSNGLCLWVEAFFSDKAIEFAEKYSECKVESWQLAGSIPITVTLHHAWDETHPWLKERFAS